MGPTNSLIVASDSGTLLFVDLEDFVVREDTALVDRYSHSYGRVDLEGVAMMEPESTHMYLGTGSSSVVLEYEWHSTQQITRRFTLAGFEQAGAMGVASLTWVPTRAAKHQGYFYVGSQLTGKVFIYELPVLDQTGPEASANLVSLWMPLKKSEAIAGLAHSAGYVFVNYDDGNSNHVLIYPVGDNGLPGDLEEQYQVDVAGAQGMTVRRLRSDTWEVFFSSDRRNAVFVYLFHFVTGFELHSHCGGNTSGVLPKGSSGTNRARTHAWWLGCSLVSGLSTNLLSSEGAR